MNQILGWYSGKSLEGAKEAISLLEASRAQGCWVPGASRRVMSTLSKANEAVKFSRKHREAVRALPWNDAKGDILRSALSCLAYGSFGWAQKHDFVAGVTADMTASEQLLMATAARFAADFKEIYALIKDLDATRPIPVFTSLGVSPTLTDTLAGLDLNADTIRVCPLVYDRVERTDKDGKKFFAYVARLVWPEGTRHNASRFHATNNNFQCQACGHAIKNPYNWVPVLVDNKQGIPHSLWVGRDCAKSLFGIDMKGELEIEGRE